MNSTVKTIVFWVVILLSVGVLYEVIRAGGSGNKERESKFSEFLSSVEQGNVQEVTVNGVKVRNREYFSKGVPIILDGRRVLN